MTTTYDRAELAKQPIGYWSGEAYRRVAGAIRESLAANELTQPQWWTLNRLDDRSRTWAREGLVAELAPYSDKEEGRDVAGEIEGLVAAGLVAAEGDALVMTEEGAVRLAAARDRNGRTHRDMLAGIGDDEYAVAIDVLRRIVGNLGGDPRLP